MRVWIPQFSFTIAIAYYWILLFFVGNEEQIFRFSLLYFLFVLPSIAFIGLNIKLVLSRKYTPEAGVLLIYLIAVTIISALRWDIASIYSNILFVGTLLVILNSKSSINLKFVNSIFFISILICVVTTHLGINQFGYLPGIWEGRISLFPLIPESAFFCCIIIVVNYFHNPSRWRYLIYIIALYFLIFSGSRTALTTLVVFVFYIITLHFISFRSRQFYSIFNFIIVIIFIVIINLGSVIHVLRALDNRMINQLVFRSEQVDASDAFVKISSSRLWIWGEHIKIFSKNPLIGVGNFNLSDYATVDPLVQYTSSTGSESFFTSALARFGIVSFGLLIFVFSLQQKAIKEKNHLSYFLVLFLLITMLVYGSFIVPYNFLFLLVIGLFNYPRS